MADNSKIEWTDATWNPVRGCTRVSEGCRNCYAEGVAARFSGPGQPYAGFAERDRAGSKWTGKVELIPEMLARPLKWAPRRIFVNSMSDLFHESLPDEAIDQVFAVMAMAPQHRYQVLTKRAERMRRYVERKMAQAPEWVEFEKPISGRVLLPYEGGWPTFIWLGVSVENQEVADERIPQLMMTPAAIRFLSCEPLLGAIDLEHYLRAGSHRHVGPIGKCPIDWVIAGGESGPGARPMDLAWMRSLRDQCSAAGVAFFGKQDNKKRPLPDDLMVREFPHAKR